MWWGSDTSLADLDHAYMSDFRSHIHCSAAVTVPAP